MFFTSPEPILNRRLPLLGNLLLFAAFCFFSAGAAQAGEKTRACRLADGFDYPVGGASYAGYYKARGFWPNGHLGEDWNGTGGGNTDLGDPVYAIGRGVVVLSQDIKQGWGHVTIVRHAYRDEQGTVRIIDSLYGHLDKRFAKLGETVDRGDKIGTIGTAHGRYLAHLHFEIRKNISIGMNRSKFRKDFTNYHDPTSFIKSHRKLQTSIRPYPIPVETFSAYVPTGQKFTFPDSDADQRVSVPLVAVAPSTSPATPSSEAAPSGSSARVAEVVKTHGDTTPVAPTDTDTLFRKLRERLEKEADSSARN